MIVRVLSAAVAAAALAACASAQKPAELREDVAEYGEGIRWGNLPAAASHIPTRERADFVSEREELADDLRVGDWEVERVDWKTPDRRAAVRVTWTWHLDSRGIVHKTVTEQQWERRGKRWFLIGEERQRGEPMPGVAEPRGKAAEAGSDASARAGDR
jgi:hypothetical protein